MCVGVLWVCVDCGHVSVVLEVCVGDGHVCLML